MNQADQLIVELIKVLLYQPEFEDSPEYKELANILIDFKMRKTPDQLGYVRSLIAGFESEQDSMTLP